MGVDTCGGRLLRRCAASMAAGVLVAGALLVPVGALSSPAAVEIVPASPRGVGGCIPFGTNTRFGFSGFVYRDIPAFSLRPGDVIAFDLGGLNDVDVRRDIYLAPTNVDPVDGTRGVRALGWTRVASDDQVPDEPRGNTVVGDYELRYRSETDFTFGGGGLAVGFGAAPPGTYRDPFCRQVLVHTNAGDPSGRFFARFWNQGDQPLGDLDSGSWATDMIGGMIVYPSGGDTTPPASAATVTPGPGADGWYEPPVTVVLHATDDEGVAEVRWQVDDASEKVVAGDRAEVVLTEAGPRTLRFHAVDVNGNVEAPQLLEVRVLRVVTVEVLPGLNARSGGVAPVAVVSGPGFDAAGVDPATLTVGATGWETAFQRCASGAGLLCQVRVSQLGLTPDTMHVVVRGGPPEGRFVGSDAVRLVGRR